MDTSTLIGIIFLVVGALVALSEIHTLTIYLLFVAIGLFAAGALALAGGSLTADLILLAVIIILGMPIAHWWRGKLKNRESDAVSEDDVGRKVTVIDVDGAALRVDYRGSTWDARLDATVTATPARGDSYVIARRKGNLLILAP